MNEEMEAELTKTDSRPNNLAVSEDASVDKAVPIDIRKERNKKSYKETMSQDIKNIDTYETRTKVNTKNGDQSMRLYKNLIPKNLNFPLTSTDR